jgi:hypothetical protein
MPAFSQALILALIEMLLGYLGSKTEAAAVACATEAHFTYSPLNGSHPVANNALTTAVAM